MPRHLRSIAKLASEPVEHLMADGNCPATDRLLVCFEMPPVAAILEHLRTASRSESEPHPRDD